jgi:predicted TIM-barrel enzyme
MRQIQWLQLLKSIAANGEPLIVAGVGSGVTARGAVAGGADILAIYNTAIYRIQGLPTALAFLPYDDCNTITLSAAPQILAQASETPVIIGLGVHDKRRKISDLLDSVQRLGGAGVTNEPFMGIYSDDLRAQLEAAGCGFSSEVKLIEAASERGMLTLGWAFTPAEAEAMAAAGSTIVGAMVGVTAVGGLGSALTVSLEEAIGRVTAIVRVAKAVNPECLVLGHGGPLNDKKSVAEAIRLTGMDGYVTGSTGEGAPVEKAVKEAVRSFKSLGASANE